MIKKFNKCEKINEGAISAYDGAWVVFRYGDTDIDKIYLNKEEANLECIKANEEYEEHFRNEGKFKVKTLDEAIDQIKDYIKLENDTNDDY